VTPEVIADAPTDRRELLVRIEALRAHIEEIGAAALLAERTKPCARAVAGLEAGKRMT